MLAPLAQVAIGGAIGASARYLVNLAAVRVMGREFPWGTLGVNVLGSFLMGVLIATLARRGGNDLLPFLAVGVLGGFTTFSSFSLDAVTLWERGQGALALGYVLASVGLSILGLFAGLALARVWS